MLLSDDKQTEKEEVNQLRTVERDIEAGALSTTNQKALVVKPVVQNYKQDKQKAHKSKIKQTGNCNNCHELWTLG